MSLKRCLKDIHLTILNVDDELLTQFNQVYKTDYHTETINETIVANSRHPVT